MRVARRVSKWIVVGSVLAACGDGEREDERGLVAEERTERVSLAAVSTLVTAGSSWRYLDNGSDQGTAWRAAAFDHAAWKTGSAQLGYGDGDEATVVGYGPSSRNKYVTTYFRKAFPVANPAGYTSVKLSIRRDDGAVVFLNGREVFRTNMPSGTVGYRTFASSSSTSETAFFDTALAASDLVAGTNVLAVEVHQANVTSSDISFDLRLTADTAPSGNDPVLVGAGDIADCGSTKDTATAALLDVIPGTVFVAGDNAYENGSAAEYANCYAPTWGRHKARTRPSVGNHEYQTAGAKGYYDYFGAAAGDRATGYYSYELGTWHVVVLNSNCSSVGGCGAGSAQERWLRADLDAHPTACTLAYWHHPRFSSGAHGNDTAYQAFWKALRDHGADVVLNGHDHDYERFLPQDELGLADAARGLVEFVVGTGGRSLRGFSTIRANSAVRNASTYGVLALTLKPNGYEYEFRPIAGQTFTDSGSGACH